MIRSCIATCTYDPLTGVDVRVEPVPHTRRRAATDPSDPLASDVPAGLPSETDLPVKSAATRVGYRSPFAFDNRAGKTVIGVGSAKPTSVFAATPTDHSQCSV